MCSFGNCSCIVSWSVMVVMMLQKWMLQTSGDVNVSVNPAQMVVGLSPSLDVNCNFSIDAKSNMAEIVSLTLFRGNNSQLASVTTFSDHPVGVTSSEEVQADGLIIPGGESYIRLHWDNPTEVQIGSYQCIARGLDLTGHNVQAVNTSVVTMGQLDWTDLMASLRQLKVLQNLLLSNLEDRIASLEAEAEKHFSVIFETPPLVYNNKRYYILKAAFHDINESNTICKAYGGMLTEMDDADEYDALHTYVSNASIAHCLFIGGSDEAEDGHWILPSTNQDMPYTDWCCDGEPSSGDFDTNCICLAKSKDWRMFTLSCHYDIAATFYRYICELPT